MSQCYPERTSPPFGQQVCFTIVEWMLAPLPLGIDGWKIDDRLRIADALIDHLKQVLGTTPVFQIEAVLHGN